MKIYPRILILPVVIFTTLTLFTVSCKSPSSSKELPSPTEELQWSWRKSFSNASLENLALAWNGSKMVFAITEFTDPQTPVEGDVLIGLDHGGKGLRDWRVSGRIRRLALDGAGEKLLVALKDGAILLFPHWEKKTESIVIENEGCLESAFSPRGQFIAVRKKDAVRLFTGEGELLHSYPASGEEKAGDLIKSGGTLSFPFFNNEHRLLIHEKGKLIFYDMGKVIFQEKVQDSLTAPASSLLEGGVLAAGSAGGKGQIRFFSEEGIAKGSASLKNEVTALSCANKGTVCAAYSNGPGEQRLSLFTPDGKELWKYRVKNTAMRNSTVAVADDGKVIIAGFEELGEWSLRAWDNTGKPLWIAPIEGGLLDFKVSWNGKGIAVLTLDARIVFYHRKTL